MSFQNAEVLTDFASHLFLGILGTDRVLFYAVIKLNIN